jgi:hypothetical protein
MESLLIDIEQENQKAYDGLIVMIEAVQGKTRQDGNYFCNLR